MILGCLGEENVGHATLPRRLNGMLHNRVAEGRQSENRLLSAGTSFVAMIACGKLTLVGRDVLEGNNESFP